MTSPEDPEDPWAAGAWSPLEPPYDPDLDGPRQDFGVTPKFIEPSAEKRAEGEEVKQRAPTQSAELVEMARSLYRVIKSTEGKYCAVEHLRPGIALDLRGKSGLRQRLAMLYYDKKNKVPSDSSLKEMLTVLEGQALTAEEVPVFLRFGQVGETLYIDMGTPEGHTIAVTTKGFEVVAQAPILFRRSGLVSPMPMPLHGGNLNGFRDLLNVSDSGFRLLVGWLVAACIPNIPHPFLALTGQQGTAKTTALKMLITLVSPSPAPVGSAPTTPDDWAVTAYQEPVIGLDNVSHLQPWFQDALCKAVTGDGYKKREKYSDLDVTVLHFQRVIGMTSIDPGSLQGDVADRLLPVELEPIPKTGRRTEREVSEQFEKVRQAAHGALLDLLSRVLGALPGIHLEEMPRMADFARVLAALDKVTGWTTLPDYLAATTTAAADVIDGDLFASAVRDLVSQRRTWSGTASELLAAITPDKPPRTWPKAPHTASGKLKRITPALLTIGITVSEPMRENGTGRRTFILSKAGVPLCKVCNGEMSAALSAQGETAHASCTDSNLTF